MTRRESGRDAASTFARHADCGSILLPCSVGYLLPN
jgi:hypothetical protein